MPVEDAAFSVVCIVTTVIILIFEYAGPSQNFRKDAVMSAVYAALYPVVFRIRPGCFQGNNMLWFLGWTAVILKCAYGIYLAESLQ